MMNRIIPCYLCLTLILLSGCHDKNEKKFEDYDSDDFYHVQGIIYKVTRTPVSPRFSYQSSKFNAYYVYFLDLEEPRLGKEMDVPILIEEGKPSIILVHKENDEISFVGRGSIFDKKILDDYLEKSREHGVDYYGVKQ